MDKCYSCGKTVDDGLTSVMLKDRGAVYHFCDKLCLLNYIMGFYPNGKAPNPPYNPWVTPEQPVGPWWQQPSTSPWYPHITWCASNSNHYR